MEMHKNRMNMEHTYLPTDIGLLLEIIDLCFAG